MDTSHLANIAEDLVAHKLQQAGMFVAKPKCDVKGTDLLVFAQIDDGVKFCRIQCKGRTLEKRSARITIDPNYVSHGFVVLLYLDKTSYDDDLYCFFEPQIRTWAKDVNGHHALTIARSTYRAALAASHFTPGCIDVIRDLIARAQIKGEFSFLSELSGNIVMDSIQVSGGFIGYLDPSQNQAPAPVPGPGDA